MTWKALAIGSLVDVGGTMVFGFIYNFAYAVMLAAQGVAMADIQQRILHDPSYFFAALLIGLAFVTAGGYVAARIARSRPMVHAGLVGLIGVLVGLLAVVGSKSIMWPHWFLLASNGLTVPAALIGALFGRRRAKPSAIQSRAA